MKKALAEGEIKFQTSYQLPTPPDPEIISCRIDGARLFPVFLDPGEVLVFGYFTTAVCYSYKNDGGSKGYHVVTQTHNLAEQIPLKWEQAVPVPFPAANFRLEVTTPTSWQCWAELPPPEARGEGPRLPLLASLFPPQPRNLVVFVSGVIAVQLFPREEGLPEAQLREEEKCLPPEPVSHIPYHPSPAAGQDLLLQMLLEILFSQEQRPRETQKPAVVPPAALPEPVPGSGTYGAQEKKKKRQGKTTSKLPERQKSRPTQPTGKKIVLPAASIPGTGRGAIGAVEEGLKAIPAAESQSRTWPNLARLAPPPKPPGG